MAPKPKSKQRQQIQTLFETHAALTIDHVAQECGVTRSWVRKLVLEWVVAGEFEEVRAKKPFTYRKLETPRPSATALENVADKYAAHAKTKHLQGIWP